MNYYQLIREDLLQALEAFGLNIHPLVLDGCAILVALIIGYLAIPFLKKIRTWYFNKREAKYFNPYYLAEEIETATKLYVSTNFQNIPPSYEQEPLNTHASTARQKLMPFFLNVFSNMSTANKYYIVLADSGMGKTTFLINLFFRYKTQLFPKFNIFLFPLSSQKIERDIQAIPSDVKCKSIILLDALDEDGKAAENYITRIQTLVEVTKQFRIVVITCRTQFFPIEHVEPSEISIAKHGPNGGYHRFKKIYLSPFTNGDIRNFLFKKYPIWKIQKGFKAYKVVKSSPYLMVRPMLLSYVDDLLTAKKKFDNIFEIYHFLIGAWIEREVNRRKQDERATFKSNLVSFTEKLALMMHNDFESRATLSIPFNKISEFAEANQIELNSLDLRSRSLLNRDADGNYKFAHKSILEYFLAAKAFNDPFFLKKLRFQSFTYAQKLYRALCEREIHKQDLNSKFAFDKTNGDYKNLELTKFDANLIQLVCGFHDITSLTIQNQKISNDYLNFLRPISELKLLNLSGNHISDNNFVINFPNLEQLILKNNKIKNWDFANIPNVVYCDLSGNQIEVLSLKSDQIETLKLDNNPLVRFNLIRAPKLRSITLHNTKIMQYPKFKKHIVVTTDSEFTIFLNRAEGILQSGKYGEIDLTEGHKGIFNKCVADKNFCQYEYLPQKDANGAPGSITEGILRLMINLFASDPRLKSPYANKNISTDEFVRGLSDGFTISLNHSYFDRLEMSLSGNKVILSIYKKHD